MILGGGVAVCLLLSAHRAVIFAIAQLFVYIPTTDAGSQPDEGFRRETRETSINSMSNSGRIVLYDGV